MSDRCPICHEWNFVRHHVCDPAWEAYRPEYGDEDEPEIVYAMASKNAAIKYTEKNFSNWECPSSVIVAVRETPESPWEKFEITVEQVPSFTAESIP